MDRTTMVMPDFALSSSAQFLAKIHHAKIPYDIAAIALFPEYEDWRIILSIPSIDDMNERDRLLWLIEELRKTSAPSVLPPMQILRKDDPFIRDLHTWVPTADGEESIFLQDVVLGGRLCEEIYIFRASAG